MLIENRIKTSNTVDEVAHYNEEKGFNEGQIKKK